MGAVLPRPPTPSSMTLRRPVLATGSFIPVRLLMLELKCEGKVEHCLPGGDIRECHSVTVSQCRSVTVSQCYSVTVQCHMVCGVGRVCQLLSRDFICIALLCSVTVERLDQIRVPICNYLASHQDSQSPGVLLAGLVIVGGEPGWPGHGTGK